MFPENNRVLDLYMEQVGHLSKVTPCRHVGHYNWRIEFSFACIKHGLKTCMKNKDTKFIDFRL